MSSFSVLTEITWSPVEIVWSPEGWGACRVPGGEGGCRCLSARGMVGAGAPPFQKVSAPSDSTDINNDTHRAAKPHVRTS